MILESGYGFCGVDDQVQIEREKESMVKREVQCARKTNFMGKEIGGGIVCLFSGFFAWEVSYVMERMGKSTKRERHR